MRLEAAEEALAAATERLKVARALAANDYAAEVADAREKYDALRAQVEALMEKRTEITGTSGLPQIPGAGFGQEIWHRVEELRAATKKITVPATTNAEDAVLMHQVIAAQLALLESIGAQTQVYMQLDQRRKDADEALYRAVARTDTVGEQQELAYALDNVLPRRGNVLFLFFKESPGSHHTRVDILPFSGDTVRAYCANRIPGLEAAVMRARNTVDAIKRLNQGVQSYIDGIDADVCEHGNSIMTKCQVQFPPYVKTMLEDRRIAMPWQIRAIYEYGRISDHPGAEVLDWLLEQSQPTDPWFDHLTQLKNSKQLIHGYTPGRVCLPTIYLTKPANGADAKPVLGLMRYMYEVIANRVVDGRKRTGEEESSSAKRRVIESS